MDFKNKTLEIMRKMQRLPLEETLNLPPRSELFLLQTLYHLKQTSPDQDISVTHIARQLNVSVPTISRCLQKLVQKGWVVRTDNENDRRSVYVCLSDAGVAFVLECTRKTDELLEKVLATIGKPEMEQFFNTFDRLHSALLTELQTIQNREGINTKEMAYRLRNGD